MSEKLTFIQKSGIALLLILAGARMYSEFVPWGASFGPFALASVAGPEPSSPDGSRQISIFFNDAGAAHSGAHWTWVVEKNWLLGRVVVSEGYLGSDVVVSGDPVPLRWLGNNEFTIAYRKGRYE